MGKPDSDKTFLGKRQGNGEKYSGEDEGRNLN